MEKLYEYTLKKQEARHKEEMTALARRVEALETTATSESTAVVVKETKAVAEAAPLGLAKAAPRE
jgi:hypothetical protein